MESRHPTSKLPSPTAIVAAALLAAVLAPTLHAQSPWEGAVSVLQLSFTGPIARGLSLISIVIGGITFAFGEGQSYEARLREIVGALGGGRPVRVPSVGERTYAPATVRVIDPGGTVSARYDERTGRVLALSTIDNLGKGAAGQMIQCANLMLGLDETAGLTTIGVYP